MSQWNLSKNDDCHYSLDLVEEAKNDIDELGNVPHFKEGLEDFLKALPHMVCERGFYKSRGITQIKDMPCDCDAFIVKKLFCEGLGNGHFRVTYRLVGSVIQIIEVYMKNRKKVENKNRICKYCQLEDS